MASFGFLALPVKVGISVLERFWPFNFLPTNPENINGINKKCVLVLFSVSDSSAKVGIPIKLRRVSGLYASDICPNHQDLLPDTPEDIVSVGMLPDGNINIFRHRVSLEFCSLFIALLALLFEYWHFLLIVEQTYPGTSGYSKPARPGFRSPGPESPKFVRRLV